MMWAKRMFTLNSLLFLVIGILLSVGYYHFFIPPLDQRQSLRLTSPEYPLISPLLLCNIYNNSLNEDLVLRKKLEEFISDHKSKSLLSNMSVYVIDYKSGKWTGVNENERYDPASLLKVPIMMTYYRKAEMTPGLLSVPVKFQGQDQNEGEYFKSKNVIISGKNYVIGDLIDKMITASDNTATIVLQNYIGIDVLYNVYTDLGLPLPEKENDNIEYLSAKSYAFFFRVLYNATYLSTQYSQHALDLMTHTEFSPIRDGLPKGTIVSQKFGERSLIDPKGVVQERNLHDCGIVYKPGSPYLLCVMSKGYDLDVMKQNISELSTLVYGYIK